MKTLAREHIKPEQLITVIQWYAVGDEIRSQNRSWVGDILKVVCVDGPFIVFREYNSGENGRKHTLSLNNCEVGEPSLEYINHKI